MAQKTWVGNAQTVQGVVQATLGGTWAAGDTVRATVSGKTATFVCTTTLAADAAAGLAQAVSALATTEPEFNELESVTASGPVVTLLMPSDGTPVTITFARTTTASGTITGSTPTAPTGPEWWDNPGNWLEGAVPVAGDNVTVSDLAQSDVKYGLPGAAVAYAKIEVQGAAAGREVGLPAQNANGYPEYRPQYLLTSCPVVVVGEGGGNGPALLKLDSNGANVSLSVYSTDQGAENGSAVHWKNSGASSTLNRTAGTVRVAPRPGDAALLALAESFADAAGQAGAVAGGSQAAELYLGPGVAVAALGTDGADVECWGSVGSAEVGSGTLRLLGAGLVTGTVKVHEDGVLKHNSSGSVNKVVLDAGTYDTTGDARPHAVGAIDEYQDAVINDPDGTLLAAGWPTCKLIDCGQEDVTHDVGQNLQVTYASL